MRGILGYWISFLLSIAIRPQQVLNLILPFTITFLDFEYFLILPVILIVVGYYFRRKMWSLGIILNKAEVNMENKWGVKISYS